MLDNEDMPVLLGLIANAKDHYLRRSMDFLKFQTRILQSVARGNPLEFTVYETTMLNELLPLWKSYLKHHDMIGDPEVFNHRASDVMGKLGVQ